MPFLDLPPQMQERVVCSISAAVKYEVAANVVLAVDEKEGGKPGQWVRNSNGTYDVGYMQANTRYLADLARYGIKPEHVAAAGCYSHGLAAWRPGGSECTSKRIPAIFGHAHLIIIRARQRSTPCTVPT